MQKHYLTIGIVILIALYTIVFVATRPKEATAPETKLEKSDEKSEEKIKVLVSILPQKELVKKIGGDRVSVTELVHPGESPATYSLTAQDLMSIEKSDIYFRIGYIPFEKAHIEKITSTNPHLKVIEISEKTHLRYFSESTATEKHSDNHHNHNDNSIDPHLWLSIDNMIIHANSIAEQLAILDPKNASFYIENAMMYKNELEILKTEISQNLANITGKNLLVFHPAWGYFADEHGLTQVAIEHNGNNPTAEQISAIIDDARDKNMNVIFTQSQFSKTAAHNIANALGVPVVQINPLAENYIENMRIISQIIQQNIQ
ncbi:MAG: hypothetical protein CR972_00260 [Candidatus Moraniibacteriota bacterium]|nr:MAG: hypothetical protein CR972_00260 [Candidatus Moranbacteria bacterium]